jgi:hypothetical protein
MTVAADNEIRLSYTGSGTTGPFTTPYFLANSDIKAIKVTIADGTETVLTLTTDYTLTGAGEDAGGSLTLVSSLSSSYKLVIINDAVDSQTAEYPRNDAFPSATHQAVVDRRTMVSQRISDRLARAIRIPDGDTSGTDMELPPAVERASKVAGFDASGNVTTYDASSSVTTSDNVTFTQSGSGARATDIQTRGRQVVYATDFYANGASGVAVVGDGATDVTLGIQAALDTGKDVFVPVASSYYKLTAALTMSSNQRLFGEGARSILRQTTANANVVTISGKTDAVVDGLQIYAVGSKSSETNGEGVSIIASSSRCAVRNCLITNHRGNGVGVTDSNENIVEGNWFTASPVADTDNHTQVGSDISFQYASSRNIARGNICVSGQGTGIRVITVDSGDVADDNVIVGNVVRNTRMYGIIAYRLNAADSVLNTIIANNNVVNVSGAVEHASSGAIFGAGIYIQGSEGAVVDGNTVQNTHSAAKTFLQTLAPGGIGAVNVSRVTITNNRVRTCGMEGITVRDPNALGDSEGYAVVANNDVSDVTRSGIEIKERGRVTISNNTVDGVTREGIYIQNTTTKRAGISVIGNQVSNVTRHGMDINFCDTLTVSGNNVRTTGITGMVITNCDDVSVIGNVVNDHTTRGIQIASSCSRGVVDGNVIRGDGSSTEGIRLDANVKAGPNNVITNCSTAWVGSYKPSRALPVNDTTPSVLDGRVFVTANSSATTISMFDDGEDGQEISILFRDTNTTIDFTGTQLSGNAGVDWTPATNDSMRCVYDKTLNRWFCEISDNTA